MKRTPIIVPGQVYLHTALNEYAVVTKATKGDIQFKGLGFGGLNEAELFLERFGPVNPQDLDEEETKQLLSLLPSNTKLSTGWVTPDDELGVDENDDE